jgi:ribosomal-protein-serine acetyltransferase
MIENPILLNLPMPIFTPRLQIRPRQFGEGKICAQAINDSLEHLKPWMPFAQNPMNEIDSEIFCRKSLADFIARKDFTLSISKAQNLSDQPDFTDQTGMFHL